MPPHAATYGLFLRTPFMSAIGVAACDASAFVGAMCAFELALARVEEHAGVLPPGATDELARHLRADAFDIGALAADVPDGGNVAIPFVREARALLPPDLRPSLHRGATSQDVVDTAMMLLLKPRIARCLEQLAGAITGGAALMAKHAQTPMIARTLLQQALPITFGAKVAQWLVGLAGAERRLRAVYANGLCVQFGGPAGVLHGLPDGLGLMQALAAELDLACPVLPWHTNRQPVLELIDAIDAVAVALEKIAVDVILMAQTEVGELREPPGTGAGGSSSMPHKANPVGCVRIRTAARQIHAVVALLHNAAAQPHERAPGEWHAELAPLVDAVLLLEGAAETGAIVLTGLRVDAARMRANLAATHGANLVGPTVALLTRTFPPEHAKQLAGAAVRTAREQDLDYADALLGNPEIAQAFTREEVRAAVDPARYTGASAACAARVQRWLRGD